MRKYRIFSRIFMVMMPFVCIITLLSGAFAAQSPQIPIAGSAIPQFVQELPTLNTNSQSAPKINTILGNVPSTITMCEFESKVLPPGTPLAAGAPGTTKTWGYIVGTTCPTTPNETYLGPIIVNRRGGGSTDITWVNNLGTVNTGNILTDTKVLAYKYSTDQTLHWADPKNLMCMMDMCMNSTCTYNSQQTCTTNNDCMNMIPAFGSVCAQNYAGPIPAVVHLHGGEVPPELDGGPDAWFTSDGLYQGHGYYTFSPLGIPATAGNAALYKYLNTQEAAPIWFHDHTLGATRLNVYAGLAGGYVIEDPTIIPTNATGRWVSAGTCNSSTSSCLPPNLIGSKDIVPIILQDRMFDTNGQLFFPADTAGGILWSLNPEHPYWVPEFVGDTIVVNGKAWPYMSVQPMRYRFIFLNGSNARTYEMNLVTAANTSGPPIWVIGTDGGYLDTPVKLDPALGQRLLMQPGERYEVIIDFAGFPGTNLIINNIGRTPYPKGAPPTGNTLGRIMQFRVAACPPKKQGGCPADPTYNPASGIALRTGSEKIVRLANPATGTLANGVTAAKTRQMTLNEVMGMPWTGIDPVTGLTTAYPGGPLEILVNNTKWAGTNRSDFTGITVNGITTYYSELPQEGDTEVWEIVNLTADAHPIHLHLVQFQLINRQAFNTTTYTAAYNAAFGQGPASLPAGCTPGVFCPAYGPPLNYDPILNLLSGGKYGGNPDVGATKMVKGKMQPVYLQSGVRPPLPQEAGWKDTVIMYPGEVTRIAVRWAPTDLPTNSSASALYFPFDPSDFNGHGYVWHCHIVDHEDNEMMRPDVVTLNPLAPLPDSRPLKIGINY